MEMLEQNCDRFPYSLEDIKPYIGEPMSIDLNNNRAIFGPPHKLGYVEWDFVGG